MIRISEHVCSLFLWHCSACGITAIYRHRNELDPNFRFVKNCWFQIWLNYYFTLHRCDCGVRVAWGMHQIANDTISWKFFKWKHLQTIGIAMKSGVKATTFILPLLFVLSLDALFVRLTADLWIINTKLFVRDFFPFFLAFEIFGMKILWFVSVLWCNGQQMEIVSHLSEWIAVGVNQMPWMVRKFYGQFHFN